MITSQHSGSDYFSTSHLHESCEGLISKSCNWIYSAWPSEITYPLRASISSFQSNTNNLRGRNFQQGLRPLSRIQDYRIEDEWGGHNRSLEPCAAPNPAFGAAIHSTNYGDFGNPKSKLCRPAVSGEGSGGCLCGSKNARFSFCSEFPPTFSERFHINEQFIA